MESPNMFRTLLLLAAILLSASLQAASPQADHIFPDSTKGFVSFPNIKTFEEQWRQTQFGKLFDDPLMEDFKKDFQKQLSERTEKTFGFTFEFIGNSSKIPFFPVRIYCYNGFCKTICIKNISKHQFEFFIGE
jgi:hypothetical protein